MTKYKINLYWSDEDAAFIAEVPELAGCAADGPTRHEALANVKIVIAEWMEMAEELGRPIPDIGLVAGGAHLAARRPMRRSVRGQVRHRHS